MLLIFYLLHYWAITHFILILNFILIFILTIHLNSNFHFMFFIPLYFLIQHYLYLNLNHLFFSKQGSEVFEKMEKGLLYLFQSFMMVVLLSLYLISPLNQVLSLCRHPQSLYLNALMLSKLVRFFLINSHHCKLFLQIVILV